LYFFCAKEAPISLTSSIKYILSIAATLESYANGSRCVAKMSARNKPTLLVPHSRPWLGDNIPVGLVSVYQCDWYLLPCLESVQTVVLCRFRLRCSRDLTPPSSFCRSCAILLPTPGLLIVTDNKRYHQNHLIPCAIPVTDSCVVHTPTRTAVSKSEAILVTYR